MDALKTSDHLDVVLAKYDVHTWVSQVYLVLKNFMLMCFEHDEAYVQLICDMICVKDCAM